MLQRVAERVSAFPYICMRIRRGFARASVASMYDATHTRNVHRRGGGGRWRARWWMRKRSCFSRGGNGHAAHSVHLERSPKLGRSFEGVWLTRLPKYITTTKLGGGCQPRQIPSTFLAASVASVLTPTPPPFTESPVFPASSFTRLPQFSVKD